MRIILNYFILMAAMAAGLYHYGQCNKGNNKSILANGDNGLACVRLWRQHGCHEGMGGGGGAGRSFSK